MKSTILVVISALGLLLVVGCGGKEPQSRSAEIEASGHAAPPTGEGHADAQVTPGSYADWCGEHEVPETQCTRCDASLIPAFQAAGDWDGEHGLPMSQCTIHDPNLRIVRPPKPEGM